MRTWMVVVVVCSLALGGGGAIAGEAESVALIQKLTDPDPKVREAAAAELEKTNADPIAVVQPLLKALKDENPKVRACALDLLAQMMMELSLNVQVQLRNAKPEEAERAFQAAQEKVRARMSGTPAGEALARSNLAANESAAIAACKTYAEAQDIYRRTDWDGDGVLEYAQSFKGDFSLFERTKDKEDLQLIDRLLADAEGDPGGKASKAGYRFKVLKGQGPDAPGGQKSYVRNGNMTIGYGLVAYPAEYDVTGRNTFLINNTGTVYQKDLGAETPALVGKMTEYNPDKTWTPAE